MSIPPLVCSTPPPPDQCEDDKEPEDFDIPYNLSQEDDDGYDYGNFTTFNPYTTTSVVKNESVLICNNIEALTLSESRTDNSPETIPDICTDNHQNYVGTNITIENNVKCEEDINIEDLNLEVSEEPPIPAVKLESERTSNSESPENVVSSENDISELSLNSGPPSPCEEENIIENPSPEYKKEILDKNVELEEPPILEPNCSKSNDNDTSYNNNDKDLINENVVEPINELKQNEFEPIGELKQNDFEPNVESKQNESDDDFGDFDDFQFVSSDPKSSPAVEICDNPWESNVAETSDFGNFTANFDTVTQPEENDTKPELSNQDTGFSNDDNDDFGDFDDFQSSTTVTENSASKEETMPCEQIPVLDFHMSGNESQVIDSITKVLNTIFDEELPDPGYEYESKLESCLSVAWEQLKETDVRQPYMVNWNNSLGQKTLLKALCIDSRNILFGPKWSYNTPKFAANLSVAPLQPQKPATPAVGTQSDVATEKPLSKEGTWADPFTSDGQEFTYAEALLLDLEHLMATLDQMAHNHSTLKISELLNQACNTDNEPPAEVRPSSLDVFEASISPKSDKIYSSTLNVQPLRQINLPDTHIFTPTDSETPRSKTIHYDRVPPILLPQTAIETKKVDSPIASNTPQESKDEDEYWEFQDFRGSEVAPPQVPKEPPQETKPETVLKPNVTSQTQVLQPIKMEPLMPTLNWPDPGEVKETFEDFSDFISNSAWSNDKISVPESKNVESNVVSKDTTTHPEVVPKGQLNSQEVDDDFDTFQSAPPNTSNIDTFNSLPSTTFNHIPPPSQSSQILTNFEYAFPKSEIKSDLPINSNIPSTLGITNSATLTPNKSSSSLTNQVPSSLIQPMVANVTSAVKPQKTAQILQPLSLESYSQINWPNPGIDLQDLSRFNPVETLQSLKSDLSVGGSSKVASPVHAHKVVNHQPADDDIWGEFVSSKPKQQQPKKAPVFADDDEWTDFVSSPTVKPQNGLNTISLNVHTNSNIQKNSNVNKFPSKTNQVPIDIPTLHYITPKASGHSSYNSRHFQNL